MKKNGRLEMGDLKHEFVKSRISHLASRRAFTLVELLVTIGIIAVLAALLMPAVSRAMVQAQKSRAQVELAGIVSACKAYYAEYGVWPNPADNGWPDHTYGSKKMSGTDARYNVQVMDILRDRATANNVNHVNNKRRIVFLEIPPESMTGSDQRSPVNNYVESEGYYLDPWGEPYVLCFDTDMDGELGFSGLEFQAGADDLQALPNTKPGASNGGVLVGANVGVMSHGPEPNVRGSALFSWGKK